MSNESMDKMKGTVELFIESGSIFNQYRTLCQADKMKAQESLHKEILSCLYQNGKGHYVVFHTEDIAVLHNHVNPSWEHSQYTACFKTEKGWEHSNTYYESVDHAMLGALEHKHLGFNSQFSSFAYKMLGLGKEEE